VITLSGFHLIKECFYEPVKFMADVAVALVQDDQLCVAVVDNFGNALRRKSLKSKSNYVFLELTFE
jgi:hypothetical protein